MVPLHEPAYGDAEREPGEFGSYPALLDWALQGEALDPASASVLRARAGADPAAAQVAFDRAVEFGQALFRIFAGRIDERPASTGDFELLNIMLREALARAVVAAQGESHAWGWEERTSSLSSPLWPVAVSAARLLTSPDLVLVRRCAGDDCEWLFMDTSRNRSKRWCNMSVCGNRAKARRFYERRRRAEA